MFKVITKALVFKEDKMLVLKRSKGSSFAEGLWDIPGGKLVLGESLEESLLREIYEETKINIKIEKTISASSSVIVDNNKQYITIVYLCEYLNGDVKLNNEHNEYKWIRLDEIDENNTLYYALEAITNCK